MKLTNEEIQLMASLEKMTGANARSCLIDKKLISFIVDEGKMKRIIGKNGSTLRKINQRMNRPIELIVYSKDKEDFVRKNFPQIKIESVAEKEGIIFLHLDPENKRKLLGKTGKMRRVKEVGKDIGIKDIKLKGYRD